MYVVDVDVGTGAGLVGRPMEERAVGGPRSEGVGGEGANDGNGEVSERRCDLRILRSGCGGCGRDI